MPVPRRMEYYKIQNKIITGMFLKQKNKKVYKLRLCLTKFYM